MSEPFIPGFPQVEVSPEPVPEQPQENSPEVSDAPVVPYISDNKTVVYTGENSYYDNMYGTLNRGDMRTVTPETADELCSRQSDGKTLFAVI